MPSQDPGLTPIPPLEIAKERPELGDARWFDARRRARPARKHAPAGGVLLPEELLRGGNELVHESFVPPQAEVMPSPTLVGPRPVRPLRRFSRKKGKQAQQTSVRKRDS